MLLAACSVKPGPVTLMKQNVPPDALPCGGCTHCIKRDLGWKDFNNMIDDVIPLSKINSEEHIYPKCHRECPLGGSVQGQCNISNPKDPKLSDSNWAREMQWQLCKATKCNYRRLIRIKKWLILSC